MVCEGWASGGKHLISFGFGGWLPEEFPLCRGDRLEAQLKSDIMGHRRNVCR